jgi:predicted nucleotide-binding protein
MGLPVKTVAEDIDQVCNFLGKKPTGASVKEARAVLDSKHLDARKLAALRGWGFIEDVGEKMKLTAMAREFVRGTAAEKKTILCRLIQSCAPYAAIIERAVHRKEESVSSTDVGALWHDHFADDVGSSDTTLNDQALTLFSVCQAAGLGEVTLGRRGSPTRFTWDKPGLAAYESCSVGDGGQRGGEPPLGNADQGADRKDSLQIVEGEGSDLMPPQKQSSSLGQSIFLAHGRNKVPLEQLQKILRQFNIPHKTAVEEPNLGRPIGVKVREVMQACNCAILIFTADELLFDKDGKEVWRPSQNVGHELGACGFLYENRIVIIKEDKIDFPTNYKELGYISFSAEMGLESKAMEVLKELIGFGIVKVST